MGKRKGWGRMEEQETSLEGEDEEGRSNEGKGEKGAR